MSAAIQAVEEAEAQGVPLRLVNEKVKANFPAGARDEITPVLDRLRANRTEVAEVLRQRFEAPTMSTGIRLLAWQPKQPPVAITTWAVVTDIPQFIRSTLTQLEAALRGDNWLAGNWSVRDLLERLEQVGVTVEAVRGERPP